MKHLHTHEELEHIWREVPPNYYQRGVKRNFLQRLWHTGKLKTIASYIEPLSKKGATILDVGSASGWFLSEIKKKFPKLSCTGIDAYKEAVLYGKKKYNNIKLVRGDAHDIPFPSETFDIIICNEVLEHVMYPKKVLEEIKRVLKKDGIAIIEMDTGNILFRITWYWWAHMRHGVWEDAHIQIFNTQRLEQLIKRTGFIIQQKKLFNMTMAVAILCKK